MVFIFETAYINYLSEQKKSKEYEHGLKDASMYYQELSEQKTN